ncbi:MAG TPA: alpha/beta fold hydrolase [Pyrinomonadaceae bacterium]|nr:alpha/beta fold hydrolase [Pyrinomonadaceae bacterium]
MPPRRIALASLIFLVLLASFSVLPGQPSPSASARQRRATQETPQSGRIEISSQPDGYPLFIDGQPAGETTSFVKLISLEPGAHRIEVVFPGGQRWVRDLSIRSGQKICISLTYRPKSPGAAPPERRRLPPSTEITEFRQGSVTATVLNCGVASSPPTADGRGAGGTANSNSGAPSIILRSPQPTPTPQPTPLADIPPEETPPPPPSQPTPQARLPAPRPSAPEGPLPRVGSPPSPDLPRSTRLPPPPPPDATQAEAQKKEAEKAKNEDFKIVPIFYGTDRRRTGKKEPGDFYGAEIGELELGKCEISIPKTHVRGKLEAPSIWRGEFKEDPKLHIVLLNLTPLGADEFNSQFQTRLGEVKSRDVFVFIHGYNVEFVDAARRTAQLANDLDFPGVPVLYSWPSHGTFWDYFADGRAAKATEPHLKQFLSGLVAQANGARIHLVAHSMGNRALTGVLKSFAAENAGQIFSEVILTAPDIDAETLREIAPDLKKVARHLTLYASSGDAALVASQKVNGARRAGDSLPEMVVVPGIDSIDATGIDTDMTNLLGHSYFAQMKPVMDDINLLLLEGKLPAERKLLVQVTGAGTYWSLPGVLVRPNGERPGLLWWSRYLTVTNIVIFVILFVAFVAMAVWLVLRARRRRGAAAVAA